MGQRFESILDRVLAHAERTPRRLCVCAVSKDGAETSLNFAEVARRAGHAAGRYLEAGVAAGDIVILLGTHHADFYAAWLGAVWIGAVPSVLAEPSVRIDRRIYWTRLRELLQRIDAKVLAIDPRVALEGVTHLKHFTYEALAAPVPSDRSPPVPRTPDPQDMLLLQHSSGTTGLQKGVMLSHAAVLRHAESYLSTLQPRDDDVVASWLPLYHDMGLIACFVSPLIAGLPVIWLSPFEWVERPSLLLQAITRHRATLAWLPNFAFSFLGKRGRGAGEKYELSTLRAVINCSEPVTEEAMSAFADHYLADGLDPSALHTCYAMAENVFAVTATTADDPPKHTAIDETRWRNEHRAVPAAAGVVQVSNGRPVPGVEVRVASAGPGCAGRILIRSPFLLSGYFRRPELNAALLDADGFYDTGDVGWLDESGHLYVTGRMKDLLIVGGRNIYPQDLEQLVEQLDGIHAGRSVCFGVTLRGMGTQGPVVLAESHWSSDQWPALVQQVYAAVPAQLDLDLADVKIVAPATLRKSTAGKLARGGNREWYLEGRFGPVPRFVEKE